MLTEISLQHISIFCLHVTRFSSDDLLESGVIMLKIAWILEV